MSLLSLSELGVKLTLCDDLWGTLEHPGKKISYIDNLFSIVPP